MYIGVDCIGWSGRRRLQWEQHELKAPQERSDEEIEAVPTKASAWSETYTIWIYLDITNQKLPGKHPLILHQNDWSPIDHKQAVLFHEKLVNPHRH